MCWLTGRAKKRGGIKFVIAGIRETGPPTTIFVVFRDRSREYQYQSPSSLFEILEITVPCTLFN